MAINWEQLNLNLGKPEVGNALGLLSAALLRGGARTTDLGAGPRGVGEAFEAFTKGLRQGREDEERKRLAKLQEKFQTAQLGGLEAETKERERLAKAREASMEMLGYDPEAEAFRRPGDYAGHAAPYMDQSRLAAGPRGMEIPSVAQIPEQRAQDDPFKGFSPQDTRMIQALALTNPSKAVEKYFEVTKSSLKAPTMVQWFGPRGGEQAGFWDKGKFVPHGGEKAASTGTSQEITRLQAVLGKMRPNDPNRPAIEARIVKLSEWEPDSAKPSSSRYSPQGAYVDATSGAFLGEGYFDGQTNQLTLRKIDGSTVSMPPNARPRTESALDKNAMDANAFRSLQKEIGGEEVSMGALQRYMSSVKNTRQGFGLIADQLLAQFDTLIGRDLDPEEFRTMLSNGQLQRLLGGFRKEVVGGGVMTEKDALRILAALGGEISLLRNKDVAVQLLQELFADKAKNFNEYLVPSYNFQLGATPRGAFPQKQAIPIEFEDDPRIEPLPSGVTQEEWDNMPKADKDLWR
jgi:hypothetical protein